MKFVVFSTDGVSGVKDFTYVCCVCGLVSLSSWLFLLLYSVDWSWFDIEPCS
jgi:hypothetical protein